MGINSNDDTFKTVYYALSVKRNFSKAVICPQTPTCENKSIQNFLVQRSYLKYFSLKIKFSLFIVRIENNKGYVKVTLFWCFNSKMSKSPATLILFKSWRYKISLHLNGDVS